MKLRRSSIGLLFLSFAVIFFSSIKLANNKVQANTVENLYSQFKNVVEINVGNGPISICPTFYTRTSDATGTRKKAEASETLYVISGSKTKINDYINYNNNDTESVTYNVLFSNLTLTAGTWCAISTAKPIGNLSTINLNLYLYGTNSLEGYNHAALANYEETGKFNVVFYPFDKSKSTFNARYPNTKFSFYNLNPKIAEGWYADITVADRKTENISDGLNGKPTIIEGTHLNPNSLEAKNLNGITYGDEIPSKENLYTDTDGGPGVDVKIKKINLANGSSSIPSSDTYYEYQPYPSSISTKLNAGTYDIKIYQAKDMQNRVEEKEVHTTLKITPKKIKPKITISNKEYDGNPNFSEENIFLINSSNEQKNIKGLEYVNKDYFEENYSPINLESVKFSIGSARVETASKTNSTQSVTFKGWSVNSVKNGNANKDNYELVMPTVSGTINAPTECNLDEVLNLKNTAIIEDGILKNRSNNGWFNSTISLNTKQNYKILYTTAENSSLPNASSSWNTKSDYSLYNQSTNPTGLKDADGTNTSEILSSSSGATRIYFYIAKLNSNGNIIQIYNKTTLPYKLSTAIPTGKIEIADSYWDKLLKITGFGIFKSETQTVTITPGESISGTTVEYLIISGNDIAEYINVDVGDINTPNTLAYKIANASGWKKYDGTNESTKPKVSGQVGSSKGNIVFAKIGNNAGKISYINSDGILIYTQSSSSDIETTYTKFSNSNPITIQLNGNTIKDIYLSSELHNLPSTLLIKNKDYKLSESLEGSNNYDKITLLAGNYNQKGIFDNLTTTSYKAGTTSDDRYTLTVELNPGGIENIQWTSESGEKPKNITIKLEVKKAEDKINFDSNFFIQFPNNQITYSKKTINLPDPATSEAGISSKYEILDNGEPLPKDSNFPTSDQDKVATLSGNQLNINRTGKFKIKIISLGNEDYNSASAEHTITVNKKSLSIEGIKGVNKEYDGTVATHIDVDEASIYSTEPDDEVSLTLNGKKLQDNNLKDEDKEAEFENSKIGNNKTVTPSKTFDLIGKDSYKYIINQPTTTANISKCKIRPINISIEPKVYDGTRSAKITNIEVDGKIGNEIVNFDGSYAYFDSPNVTTSESKDNVTIRLTINGQDKENYECEHETTPATGTITKRKVKVETGNFIKFYDSNTTISYESGYPKLEENNSERGILIGDLKKVSLGHIPNPCFENPGLASEDSFNIKIIFDGEFSITKGTAEEDGSNNYILENPRPEVTGTIQSGFEVSDQGFYSFPNSGTSTSTWIGLNNSFKIKASEGYKIGKSIEEFCDEISWDDPTDENGKEVIFYVNDTANDRISKPQKVTYFKDDTPPQGTISISTNNWSQFINTITFGAFCSEINDINISPTDTPSGVKSLVWWKDSTSNSYSNSEELERYIAQNSFEWQTNLSNLGGTAFSASPNDKFVVYAKITDQAGNIGYINSNGVIFNNSKPSIQISAPDFETSEWSKNKNSKIEVNIYHDLPVITRYSYKIGEDNKIEKVLKNGVSGECASNESFSIENLPDGEYDVLITATAEPENENLTQIKSVHVKKDTEFPRIWSVSGNSTNYTNDNVTLTVEASDKNLATNAYSFDNGNSWQVSDKKSYSQNETIPQHYIKVRDKAGNITSYDKEIIINKIDKLKPSKPKILGFSNVWTNTNVELSVISEDASASNENASSNISYFEYTLDGGKTFKKSSWNQHPSFTISANGDYTNLIAVKVTDTAGNTSELSDWVSVKIDKTLPTITSVSGNPSTWVNKNVSLIIKAQESLSGINSYSFDGGLSWQSDNFKVYDSNQKILAGSLCVKDNAGNVNRYNEEIIIDKIDKDKPNKPQLMGNLNVLTNEDVKVYVMSKDKSATHRSGSSGISKFEYSIDGGKTFNSLPWNEQPSFIINKSGDYTNKIAARIIDNAGNISDLSDFYSVKINKNNFDQTDSSTGIIIQAESGVFPQDAQLKVTPKGEMSSSEKFDSLEEIYGQLDESIKNTLERVNFYDISVLDSTGKEIQPKGSVTINIPLPENFDKSEEDIDIYRVQQGDTDDDSFEESLIDINGKTYCQFETDHFSLYALVDKNTKSEHNSLIAISFVILFLIILILIFIYGKKKFKIINKF